jgi:hypothetical protein
VYYCGRRHLNWSGRLWVYLIPPTVNLLHIIPVQTHDQLKMACKINKICIMTGDAHFSLIDHQVSPSSEWSLAQPPPIPANDLHTLHGIILHTGSNTPNTITKPRPFTLPLLVKMEAMQCVISGSRDNMAFSVNLCGGETQGGIWIWRCGPLSSRLVLKSASVGKDERCITWCWWITGC